MNKTRVCPWRDDDFPAHVPSVVYVRSHDRFKVALICGGGAGHEPAHAGYVGKFQSYPSSFLQPNLQYKGKEC